MAHAPEPALLHGLSTPYLQALGELAIGVRLLRRARVAHLDDVLWTIDADHLLALNEALTARLGEGALVEHALTIRDDDGTTVPADLEFVRHLVDRMSRLLDQSF
jgi:hypothetical protein